MTEEDNATLARIESDLISDRTNIDKIINKLDNAISLLNTLSSRLPRLEDKQQDAIADVIKPVIDSVDNLNATIQKKTVIKIGSENWFSRILKRG